MKRLFGALLLALSITSPLCAQVDSNWASTIWAAITPPTGMFDVTKSTNPTMLLINQANIWELGGVSIEYKASATVAGNPSQSTGWNNGSSGFPTPLVGTANFESTRYAINLANNYICAVVGNLTNANWRELVPCWNGSTWSFLSNAANGLPTSQPFSGVRPSITQDPSSGLCYVATWRDVRVSDDSTCQHYSTFTVNGSAGGSATFFASFGLTDTGIYQITIPASDTTHMYLIGENVKVIKVPLSGFGSYVDITSPSVYTHDGFQVAQDATYWFLDKNAPSSSSYFSRIKIADGTETTISISLTPYGASGKTADLWLPNSSFITNGRIVAGANANEWFMSGYNRTDRTSGVFGTTNSGNTWELVGGPGGNVYTACSSDTSVCANFMVVDSNDNKFFSTGNAIYVHPGVATKLGYTQQPSNTVEGNAMSPSPAVAVQDANGNTVTSSTASITLTYPYPSGGVFGQVVSAVNGIATFDNVILGTVGTGFTFSATSTGLTSATSNTFNITEGTTASLVVSGYPNSTLVNIAHAFTVTSKDSGRNTTTLYTGTISCTASGASGFPSHYTFTGGDAGVHTFSGASFTTTGNKTITCSDDNTPAITGSQGVIVSASHIDSTVGTVEFIGTGTFQ